jgi:hypothetical protein
MIPDFIENPTAQEPKSQDPQALEHKLIRSIFDVLLICFPSHCRNRSDDVYLSMKSENVLEIFCHGHEAVFESVHNHGQVFSTVL